MTVENGFHLEHRTIRHSPPDMTKTLQKLGQRIEETSPHIFKEGRKADYIIPDQMGAGIAGVQTAGKYTTTTTEDGEELVEVDEQDLGVD